MIRFRGSKGAFFAIARKARAALGPTQGQVDARRNLSVSAEIVSAETFALWCDATRVESVDDCLAKSGQSALRLVPVHHSDPETADSARARDAPRRRPSRVLLRVPNRVVLAHNQGAEDASLARDSRSARPLPPHQPVVPPRRLPVVRGPRRARPAKTAGVPRAFSYSSPTIRWTSAWTVCPDAPRRSILSVGRGALRFGARRQMSYRRPDGRGQAIWRYAPARAPGRRPASGGGSAACASRGRGRLSVATRVTPRNLHVINGAGYIRSRVGRRRERRVSAAAVRWWRRLACADADGADEDDIDDDARLAALRTQFTTQASEARARAAAAPRVVITPTRWLMLRSEISSAAWGSSSWTSHTCCARRRAAWRRASRPTRCWRW